MEVVPRSKWTSFCALNDGVLRPKGAENFGVFWGKWTIFRAETNFASSIPRGNTFPFTLPLGWETQSFLRSAKYHYFDQKNGFKVHLSEQNTLFCMFFIKFCKFRQKEWANCRYSGWFQINEIWKYGFCITRGTLCLNFRFYCRYQMSCIQAYSRFLKH